MKKLTLILALAMLPFLAGGYAFAGQCCPKGKCECVHGKCCKGGVCTCIKGACCTEKGCTCDKGCGLKQ